MAMKKYDVSPGLAGRVEKAFQQNPLTQDQQQRIELINEKFSQVARFIISVTPECAEQTRIINKLQESNRLAGEAIKKNEA